MAGVASTASIANGAGENAASSGGGFVLEKRYVVRPKERLDYLDEPHAKACVVEDRQDADRPAFALLCPSDHPIRHEVLVSLHRRFCTYVVSPLAFGVVPLGNAKCRAIVYEAPGVRLSERMAAGAKRITGREIAGTLLAPVVEALEQLETRGITHRAIRPNNIFTSGQDGATVHLGDCCSAPPGFGQPAAYEPIDSAGPGPYARGEGTLHSDLYALGVTVLALVTGTEPGAGRSAEELLESKIRNGSYATLVGNRKLEPAVAALVAGLVTDQVEKQWDLMQVSRWVNGSFDSSQRSLGLRWASRPYIFNGQEFHLPSQLAPQFQLRPKQAVEDMLTGRLETWVRNAMADKHRSEALRAVMELAETEYDGSAAKIDEFAARASLALHRSGPLRFRDLIISLSAVGPALAEAFSKKLSERQIDFAKLFNSPLFVSWAAEANPAAAAFMPSYICTSIQASMKHAHNFGSGLEKCLYQLNPGYPCQSPLVADAYANSLRALLAALEEAAKKGERFNNLIDRHVAAFIATQHANFTADLRRFGGARDGSFEQVKAGLRIFALMQELVNDKPLPNITQAAAAEMKPLIELLKSKIRRDILLKQIDKLAAAGMAGQLLKQIDIQKASKADAGEHKNAAAMMKKINQRMAQITSQAEWRQRKGAEQGQWIATFLGFFVLLISAAVTFGEYLF